MCSRDPSSSLAEVLTLGLSGGPEPLQRGLPQVLLERGLQGRASPACSADLETQSPPPGAKCPGNWPARGAGRCWQGLSATRLMRNELYPCSAQQRRMQRAGQKWQGSSPPGTPSELVLCMWFHALTILSCLKTRTNALPEQVLSHSPRGSLCCSEACHME